MARLTPPPSDNDSDILSTLSEELSNIDNELLYDDFYYTTQTSTESYANTCSFEEHCECSSPLHLLAAVASQVLVDPVPVILDAHEDLISASNPPQTSTTFSQEETLLLQQLQSE